MFVIKVKGGKEEGFIGIDRYSGGCSYVTKFLMRAEIFSAKELAMAEVDRLRCTDYSNEWGTFSVHPLEIGDTYLLAY